MFLTLLWAQNETQIFLTIEQSPFSIDKKIIKDKLFLIQGTYNKTNYETTIHLFDEIYSNDYKMNENRNIEFILEKKEKKWWPRLTLQDNKNLFIKCDWDKWIDKDFDSLDNLENIIFNNESDTSSEGEDSEEEDSEEEDSEEEDSEEEDSEEEDSEEDSEEESEEEDSEKEESQEDNV